MPGKLSFENTFHALERAINLSQKRNTLIASNISNLDTPNYRPKDLDFKAAMDRALASGKDLHLTRTNPRHIDWGSDSALGAEPTEEEGEWNGINYVDVDTSMLKLTENSLVYRTATEALLRKIALMKEFIREGGR